MSEKRKEIKFLFVPLAIYKIGLKIAQMVLRHYKSRLSITKREKSLSTRG